jgi:WD40 repeat protein
MAPPTACIEPPRLRALLEGSLAEQEQAELQRHLEMCTRCQQTLEQLVAGQGSWSSLPRYLGADAPAPPAPAAPPAADEGVPLAFLSPSDKPGSLGRLGHYEIAGVIGRGGMGVVLKALDPRLQRVVAVKVMAPQLAASAAARQRFVREAQAVAAVRDEHVVAIHGVDEANGVPYLVMEYVSGISLQERLDRSGPLQLKEVLRIGLQAAAGLAAAHAQGLVHRDIKPANVLLENGVERVKITDFGLARAADAASLSESGVVAGTPMYMAPEQALGEHVDARADLFSLGSVLYAMATGRPPFRAGGPLAVLKRVCEDTPRPVREINPEMPEWLGELIARLHAKDPAQRLGSAAEVTALLGKHLARLQQPDAAPPPPTAVTPAASPPAARPRRRRWGLAVVALLALLGGLGLTEATGTTRLMATVIRVFTPDGTLVVETDDPGVKVAIEGDGDLVITGAGPHEVRLRPGQYRWQATRDGKPVAGDLVTISRGGRQVVRVSREGAGPTAAPPASPLDRLDPAAIPATERFDWQPKELVAVLGEHRGRHWDTIRTVACSPDGKLVASAGYDGVIMLADAETLRARVFLRGHTRGVWSVAFAPDSHRLLSGSSDGTVRLWDVAAGQERLHVQPGGDVYGVCFSPDGRRALSATHGGLVQLWDADTGKELKRLKGHRGWALAVAFSPDGKRAVSGGADHTARVWDLDSGEELCCFQGHPGAVAAAAFLPDGRRVLSGHVHQARDGRDLPAPEYDLRLWDADTGKELRRYPGHREGVASLALSADGRRAVTAGHDGTVRLWVVEAGRELYCLEGDCHKVWGAALAPDGRRAFSGGEDRTVRQWDLDAGKELAPSRGHRGGAHTVAFSPDGRYLLSGSHEDPVVRLWDVAGTKELAPFQGPTSVVWCVAYSPDGRLALSGGPDRTLRVWDVPSRKEIHTCAGHAGWTHSVAVAPDGRRALTGGWYFGDNTVRCWDLDGGVELSRFEVDGGAASVAFAPDGRRALTGGWGKVVCLWDVDSRQVLRRFEGHTGLVTSVAFAPDGRRAASGGYDSTVWLWSLTTPEQPAVRLRGHTGKIYGVAFAPDGKTLASCDWDGRVILWDGKSGELLREWRLPGGVNAVAWDPDSRHLALANFNGTIYILRLK